MATLRDSVLELVKPLTAAQWQEAYDVVEYWCSGPTTVHPNIFPTATAFYNSDCAPNTMILWDKEHSKVAGVVILDPFIDARTVCLSIFTRRCYWGNITLYKELIKGIHILFDDIRFYRLECETLKTNAPAKKLLERLGFRCEGEKRGAWFIKNQPKTTCLYSLIKPDWFQRTKELTNG